MICLQFKYPVVLTGEIKTNPENLAFEQNVFKSLTTGLNHHKNIHLKSQTEINKICLYD